MPDPYFSELKYLGGPSLDFIEVVVDAGADVSNLVVTIYHAGGTVRSSNAISGLTKTTIAGKDIYIIELGAPASFTGLGKTNGISLSDSGTVYAFNSFTDNAAAVTATAGPANGLTSDEIGIAGSGSSLESNDGGATYTVQPTPTPGSIPCLVAGTNIQTADGVMRVEDLQSGTKILTMDGTCKPLLKSMSKSVSARDMERNPKLYPVRICAGALGQGLPTRDLLVSRQHRMLVASPIVKRMFDTTHVLVAAIKLVGLPGIFVDTSHPSVQYFHLLFDRHEVIYAEGAPTESLLLGREAIKALPDDVVAEVQAIFPDFAAPLHDAGFSHLIPSEKRQSRLVARHVVNRHELLSSYSA
ncbi:MAG: Hint domain-containing protein [Roseicyclus sp.]|nr:Hint domain-containing protein [Roseicyclus sp.]